MRLEHEYIQNINYYENPTLNDLQNNICQLESAIYSCHSNIRHIADTVEQIMDVKIYENTRNIYKILSDLNMIDISENEFLELIREEMN